MRKLMLVMLVAAMAVPAMADVEIIVSDNGDASTADILYVCTGGDADGDKALMAGLAIIVTVDAGDMIRAVVPAIDGESTAGDPGYGVFMKTAQIDMTDPCAPVWATPGTASPIAAPGDPGTVGGIDQYQITLELGALFADPCDDMANAPLASGTLCTIEVTDDDTSGDSVVTLALEDVARGGIVMEGGADPCGVTLTGTTMIFAEPPCYEGQPDYAEWVDAGSPDCWCYPRQCHGDADGLKEGNPIAGYWHVGTPDLAYVIDAWLVKNPPKGLGLSGDQGCADFSHTKEGNPIAGYWRVGTPDLGIMIVTWLVKEVPKGLGVPTDCLPGTIDPSL